VKYSSIGCFRPGAVFDIDTDEGCRRFETTSEISPEIAVPSAFGPFRFGESTEGERDVDSFECGEELLRDSMRLCGVAFDEYDSWAQASALIERGDVEGNRIEVQWT
jgi:hypothetical protein